MKETALTLLKIAAELYTPISDLMHSLLDAAPPEHKPLADEIRARLPMRSKTEVALDALDNPGDPR